MDRVLISVVTVCFNAEKDIEYTINSVLNQNYDNFEYLIKDGQSGDSTVDTVKSYSDFFAARNIAFKIISESDDGIYDAMNKAAGYVTGRWVIYLNAGDALYDENTLADLSSELTEQHDLLYGNAVLLDKDKFKLFNAGSIDRIKYCNPTCHQAVLTKKEVIMKYPFDGNYDIAADFDQLIKIYMADEKRVKKINRVICIYKLGGISGNNVSKREKEFNLSRKANGMKRVMCPRIQIIRIVFVDMIRKMAIGCLGEKFYSEKRGWYSDKYRAVASEK